MTQLQQKIGSLEAPRETKQRSRASQWFATQAYSLGRGLLTVLYVVMILVG
jgi:hypothetical protein